MTLKALYRFLFGTLRGRLIIGVAAVHAVMMALFIGDLTARQRAMLLDRQIAEATALSQVLATSSAGWIAADDVSGLQELMEAQRRYPEILFAILADQQGRVLADTDKSRQGLYMLDLPREARQTVLSGAPSLVDVAAPAMIGGRHVGWARVGVGQKAAGAKLAEVTRSGVVYALAAILIGSAIAWFMGLRITRRLYAVQETIDAVRSGNLLARSTIAGFDEAAVMAREFNSMLDALAHRGVELRTSEERYRSLIQKVQTAIVLYDSEGRILISNPLAQELLGLSADQLLGKALIDQEWHFLQEDGSVMPVAEYPVNLVLSRRQPLRGHVTGISRPDRDDVAWVLVNAEPEYDDAGEIALVVVSFVDITERKRAEEQVKAERQRFNDVMETLPVYLVLLTTDYHVTYANRVFKERFGESHGPRCFESMLGRTEPCETHAVLKTRAPHEWEWRGPDGRSYFVHDFPFTDTDGSTLILEMGIDITEQKSLEDQLRQAQKMEAIGRLAGGIAHDFNNILTVIIGYGTLLKMGMQEDDPLQINVEQLLSASERAANLTRSLLAFSRNQVIRLQPMELNEIVRNLEKFLVRIIGEDVAIRTDLAAGELMILADRGQIEQVLMNLATNGRDAMPHGGTFTIGTGAATLDDAFIHAHGYGKAGRYALVTVTDTGTGMDEETCQRIFEPFFTTKEPGKGTGLGLSVVYGIVKQHDGYIYVNSNPGRGTTFSMYLPLYNLAQPDEALPAPAPHLKGTETVLLAEDDDAIRALIIRVLREQGYTVIEAANGEEAVKRFSEHRDTIRLLIFDLIMPKMNGREACEEIMKLCPTIRSLFVSGYTADLLEQKGLLAAGMDLVMKPLSPFDLLRKVREVLDSDLSK